MAGDWITGWELTPSPIEFSEQLNIETFLDDITERDNAAYCTVLGKITCEVIWNQNQNHTTKKWLKNQNPNHQF